MGGAEVGRSEVGARARAGRTALWWGGPVQNPSIPHRRPRAPVPRRRSTGANRDLRRGTKASPQRAPQLAMWEAPAMRVGSERPARLATDAHALVWVGWLGGKERRRQRMMFSTFSFGIQRISGGLPLGQNR